MQLSAQAQSSSTLPQHIEDILEPYPSWRAAVVKARALKQWPADKEPTTVEIYDQEGLLAGRLYNHAYSPQVALDRQSLFQAWFFNGKLVVFYVGNEVIVNRLTHWAENR
ncbi:MAG: hypothetical protein AAFY41_00505 [Bacteroidota bacterium]